MRCAICVLTLAGWLAAGVCACGESEDQIPTYTLYGTMTSTSHQVHAKGGFALLVSPGDSVDDPLLESSSCQFSGSLCAYRMLFVPEGEYTLYGMVDMNDNASRGAPRPDAGDLITDGVRVILWEKTMQNLPDSLWHFIPDP